MARPLGSKNKPKEPAAPPSVDPPEPLTDDEIEELSEEELEQALEESREAIEGLRKEVAWLKEELKKSSTSAETAELKTTLQSSLTTMAELQSQVKEITSMISKTPAPPQPEPKNIPVETPELQAPTPEPLPIPEPKPVPKENILAAKRYRII